MPIVLAPIVLSLGFLLAFAFLYQANQQGHNWLEPLLAGIAPKSRGLWGVVWRIGSYVISPLTDALSRVYHNVLHVLSLAAIHKMGPVNAWLHAQAARTRMLTRAHSDFALATATALQIALGHTVPAEIGARTRPISRRAKAAWGAAIAAGAAVAALRRWARHAINHDVLPRLRIAYHAGTVALPRDIAGLRTRTRRVEDKIDNPSRPWLQRTAVALWLAGLAGLFMRTLARRFPWLFCRKVKTVGNRLCGLPDDLLGNLLLGTIVLAGPHSLREFVEDAQAIEDEAIDALRAFIREF